MQFKTYTLTFTLLLLTSACPGKSGEDTDSTTDPTTTSSSTTDDMPTTDPTSTGGTTDDALATEADPTAATEGEETTSVDTDSEPGPVSPELESACRAACQNELMCEEEADDELEECVIGCGEEFSGLPAECDAQTLGFLNCIGASSCFDLEGQIEESGCAEEFEAFVECTDMGPSGCVMGQSQGEDECGLSTDCPDEPLREFVCDTETCTCLEGGVEVASCPAEGVCLQGDAIFDKRDSCCNFE